MHGFAQLDPEVAAAFAASRRAAVDFGAFDLGEIPELRQILDRIPLPTSPATTATSDVRVIPGTSGDSSVRVRVYRPENMDALAPTIFWIHGGGYVAGSGVVEDIRLNRWTADFRCVIVSVDYRLAPEHPYPAPLDDCYTALLWTVQHAEDLGVNMDCLAIVGSSAGGGLAAGLALLARDRDETFVTFQLLINPMIDDRNTTRSSHLNTIGWSRAANIIGWRAYLGDAYGKSDLPIYAAPARARDLAGLPPTFVAVGASDVLRDESIAYASALLAAGIETELHVYPGAPHGFVTMAPYTGVARRCQRDIDDALRRALRPAH